MVALFIECWRVCGWVNEYSGTVKDQWVLESEVQSCGDADGDVSGGSATLDEEAGSESDGRAVSGTTTDAAPADALQTTGAPEIAVVATRTIWIPQQVSGGGGALGQFGLKLAVRESQADWDDAAGRIEAGDDAGFGGGRLDMSGEDDGQVGRATTLDEDSVRDGDAQTSGVSSTTTHAAPADALQTAVGAEDPGVPTRTVGNPDDVRGGRAAFEQASRVGGAESRSDGRGFAHLVFHGGGEQGADVLGRGERGGGEGGDVLSDAGVGAVDDLQGDRFAGGEGRGKIGFVVGQRGRGHRVDRASGTHGIVQVCAKQVKYTSALEGFSPIPDWLGGGSLRERGGQDRGKQSGASQNAGWNFHGELGDFFWWARLKLGDQPSNGKFFYELFGFFFVTER